MSPDQSVPMVTHGVSAPGDEILLRYLYPDGTLQAAMPMRIVQDDDGMTVAWLAPATPIMYWATIDGEDPRTIPLAHRFDEPLSTAPRLWQGPGVLRVMPAGEPYQVVHFWSESGTFAGWYINFEAERRRHGNCIDTIDWHLDLWISADVIASWKDEDEASAAVGTPYLRAEDLRTARETGGRLLTGLSGWPAPVGDWRGFRPDPAWPTPVLEKWATAIRSTTGCVPQG